MDLCHHVVRSVWDLVQDLILLQHGFCGFGIWSGYLKIISFDCLMTVSQENAIIGLHEIWTDYIYNDKIPVYRYLFGPIVETAFGDIFHLKLKKYQYICTTYIIFYRWITFIWMFWYTMLSLCCITITIPMLDWSISYITDDDGIRRLITLWLINALCVLNQWKIIQA